MLLGYSLVVRSKILNNQSVEDYQTARGDVDHHTSGQNALQLPAFDGREDFTHNHATQMFDYAGFSATGMKAPGLI